MCRSRIDVARDDADLARPGGMIAAQTAGVPVAWLVARAAGLVAFALLTVAVTLGLAISTRLLGNKRGKLLLGWHQTLMWSALAMLVLHGGALAVDPIMRFGFVGVLVPARRTVAAPARRRRHPTGWLMLGLAASFHVRRHIGQRRWRLMHYASFAAFAIGLYHALNVGTDLVGTRGLIFAGIVSAPVVWLVFARILCRRPGARPPPARPAPPALSRTADPSPRPPRPVPA